MRVILLAPEYPGLGPSYGVGAYIAAQARTLARAGAEVLVLAATATGCHRIAPDGAPEAIAHARAPSLLRPATAAAVLIRECCAWRPDVVEAPNWGGLGALVSGGWARAVRLSTPVLAIRPRSALRRLAARGHHDWEALSVRRAHAVIANSRAMAGLGERIYGRAADAIIPHAWEGAPRTPRGDGEEVLCVGRLEHRKGTDVLLAAWSQVTRSHPRARLHLVGADVGGFGAAALARWPSPSVTVHGHLDLAALEALRIRCRIQAIPSRYESFGLVALEAWGAGLAVVASRCGGLAEVVDAAGELVEPGDPAALAEGLARLLADPRLSEERARAGQSRLMEVFSPSVNAAATVALYERLLAKRR